MGLLSGKGGDDVVRGEGFVMVMVVGLVDFSLIFGEKGSDGWGG